MTIRARLLSLLVLGLAGLPAGAAAAGIKEKLDLRYYPGRDRHTLDVFAPAEARDLPVVVFVHGGGWLVGDKNFFGVYRRVGRFLASNGVVAVAINYRLSPRVRHPEHVRDVARAYAWVRRNIRDHGGNPDRIILAGHSAGAHMVALLATDARYLQDADLGLTDADRAALKGVIAVSGVYRIPAPDEFVRMLADMVQGTLNNVGAGRLGKLGAALMMPSIVRTGKTFNPFHLVFGDDKMLREQASPLLHVRSGLPPFLILYAQDEFPTLPQMAQEMATALRDKGNQAEVMQIDRTHHNTILFRLQRPGDPTAGALLRFLEQLKR
jgi:acetyl esterase/lipase